MRLLRFIHEQITNSANSLENTSEQYIPETTGDHELKEEADHNGVLTSTATPVI